jgi:hypothetical protein
MHKHNNLILDQCKLIIWIINLYILSFKWSHYVLQYIYIFVCLFYFSHLINKRKLHIFNSKKAHHYVYFCLSTNLHHHDVLLISCKNSSKFQFVKLFKYIVKLKKIPPGLFSKINVHIARPMDLWHIIDCSLVKYVCVYTLIKL